MYKEIMRRRDYAALLRVKPVKRLQIYQVTKFNRRWALASATQQCNIPSPILKAVEESKLGIVGDMIFGKMSAAMSEMRVIIRNGRNNWGL